ncbi:hypothetical protein Q428_08875 [Fervidicella metallireducens AeB]|uniref:Uncharacterized protein n=1 Tax=Fervidicella metallireducens AeB TaxID=1403537 RepID=A0A017RV50_9CLOT|nr:hypothetical protein [Fervidicella metallireducens]EYE88304.1 hypothetical protein Q428_08875 [Fervidicella metallireducens AeB]
MKKADISSVFDELYKIYSHKLLKELITIIDTNKDNPEFSTTEFISKSLLKTYKYSVKTCEQALIKLLSED